MREYLSKISNLFKKYCIKSIDIDDIAKELGISKKTLYQHFKNKKDIINKVAEFEIQIERKELKELSTKCIIAIDQLILIFRYIFKKNFKYYPSVLYGMNKYYPQILNEIVNQRKEFVNYLLTRNFKMGIEQGIYKNNLDKDTIEILYSFIFDIKTIEMYSKWSANESEEIFNSVLLVSCQT